MVIWGAIVVQLHPAFSGGGATGLPNELGTCEDKDEAPHHHMHRCTSTATTERNMLQHEHIHVIVQCTCTLYLHTDHLTMQCDAYRRMWAHMHTHKHILCTHIHTHDPLPCHKANQNTSLQHLPCARSCGYPILHSGTVPRWHHPTRWADWSYQLQSRHWKRQLRSQRSPADSISPGHPLQSRSHHTRYPR